MSWQCSAWVDTITVGNSQAKHVMQVLANCHNPHTGRIFPKIKHLAKTTEMSERTIIRHLNELEAKGIIVRVSRREESGARTSNEYVLPGFEAWRERAFGETEADTGAAKTAETQQGDNLTPSGSQGDIGDRGVVTQVAPSEEKTAETQQGDKTAPDGSQGDKNGGVGDTCVRGGVTIVSPTYRCLTENLTENRTETCARASPSDIAAVERARLAVVARRGEPWWRSWMTTARIHPPGVDGDPWRFVVRSPHAAQKVRQQAEDILREELQARVIIEAKPPEQSAKQAKSCEAE